MHRKRSHYSWAAFAFAILVLIAVCKRGLSKADRNRQRTEAANHLYGLVCNLHFRDYFGDPLPAAIEFDEHGHPLRGWRLVTCSIDFGDTVQVGFYGQGPQSVHKEPWDSPNNRVYYDGPHRNYFGSPMSFINPHRRGQVTRFVAVTGRDTAFENGVKRKLCELPRNLILMVEIRNSGHHWMEPGGDFNVTDLSQSMINDAEGKGISGHDPRGFLVAFVDGQVWMISNDVPLALLEKFFRVSVAEHSDREKDLGPYTVWRRPTG